jgi:transcriptional regulator GlxA family with amidase domain
MDKYCYNQAMTPSLFVCYPKALLTSISLPMEMIAAASAIARIKRTANRDWQCYVVSDKTGSEKTSADKTALDKPNSSSSNKNSVEPTIEFARGLQVSPSFNLSSAPQAHTIFLPPIWGKPDFVVEQSPQLIDWLIQQYQKGAKICATGTGVCLLAQAGLLDGKAATTHWYYFDAFEKKYPKVNLQKQHFITQAGDLYCCGSINALVDLTLYFIENYFGKDVSRVIEQHFSHEVNRTYDKPWYSTGMAHHPDEGIIEVQLWMQSHYTQGFNLKRLANLANMSVRNFSRRFKSAVGKSPLDYTNELKIKAARELLKETNLTHQDIADQVGFKDASYFARQFKAINNITPREYRKIVRGKLFNLDG